MAASATPACAARADKAPSMSAPLELAFDAIALPAVPAEEGDPELEALVAPDGTAAAGDWDGTTKEGEAEAEVGAVLFEPVPTRAPVPQGIPSPSGWV
jgi:hypothetical protein